MKISRRLKQNAAVLGLLLAGLLTLFYPVYSNLLNQMQAHKMVVNYRQNVSKASKSEISQYLTKAEEYNVKLLDEKIPESFARRTGIKHDAAYENLLNPAGSGIMGVISIPSISVDLPIYHYTTTEILEKGAGHLFGSSLPVGGKNTHSVITAHRGLPSARMFTNLDQLEKGDKFFVEILERKLAYEVDQIKTVKPEDTQDMKIIEGEDLITLVTCTPYGQNTHRLLVRGHRIPYREGAEKNETVHHKVPWGHLMCIILGVFVASTGYSAVLRRRRKRGR